jgi:hypothetical protein
MKVLSIPNSDYKVITRNNGKITLDVGNDGEVIVTGDLTVVGDVTTIQSETLTVRDNIIQLNIDDTGDSQGISLVFNRESGVEINRGSVKPDGYFVLSDAVESIRANGSSAYGTWLFKDANGASMGLQTCSIKTGPNENLFLINQGTGYVTVTGTVDYEKNALNYSAYWPTYPTGSPSYSGPITLLVGGDDVIPNAKAMADYTTSSLYFFDDWRISDANTNVSVYDSLSDSTPGNIYRPAGYIPPTDSKIEFTVDGSERAEINANGLNVDNLRVFTDTVSNTSVGNDLILTAGNNTVRIDSIVKLQEQASDPTSTSTYGKLYTKAPGSGVGTPGKTGIYFVNTLTNDELVAKNRALLFSILF